MVPKKLKLSQKQFPQNLKIKYLAKIVPKSLIQIKIVPKNLNMGQKQFPKNLKIKYLAKIVPKNLIQIKIVPKNLNMGIEEGLISPITTSRGKATK